MVIIAVLGVLGVLVYPGGSSERRKAQRISCVNNLKQDQLALKIWGEGHNDHWPQSLSITNGGARELLEAGNLAQYFEVMSNELSTPKIFTCSADDENSPALDFSKLTNTNISYLVGLDAAESDPRTVVFADDNFSIVDISVKSGLINLWTNRSIAWTAKRHHFAGNVAFADGSVRQMSNAGLTNLWVAPGAETNWVVIP
jgi:prepilin-type processing-associated H-X9-DG protein